MTPRIGFDLPGIRHGFFGRQGGVSSGLYDSLNCGLGSNDDRAAVLENRDRVAGHLGVAGGQLLTCYQIHSATALVVDRPWAPEAQPKADGLVTRTPGLALGALAADCTPILFADPVARVIGAAHAGWKGALGGILDETIAAMVSIGATRGRVEAAVGPCIGPENYEVGPEFEAAFTAKKRNYARYFRVPAGRSRAHFNLPGFVLDQLAAAGIGRVHNASSCTYAAPKDYFSYRRTTHRGEPDYGRQISAIVLT